MRRAVLMLAVLLPAMFSGCFGEDNTVPEPDVEESAYLQPWERADQLYDDSDVFSRVSENGSYETDTVRSVYVDVPTITAADGGAGLTGDAVVHLGLWLPVIEGCDWDAGNLSEECRVPVIAEIGPYYDDGDVDALTPAERLGRFLIENYVPHGYGVAQVSVFGTGESNHCMDLMGTAEQLGIDAAVSWLGSQNWSNGNVGLYGKSYEGATQWEAAALGSEHLKTIVPISGTTALHPLLYKNGSAEARSQIMHMNYFGSTVDYNGDDLDNICPDIVEGIFAGPVTYGLGELDPYMDNYYEERSHIDKAFQNWNGSIYWIQGMQDWNVDPHQVFGGPSGVNWYLDYSAAGYDVRGMLGQWEHNYPDQWSKHNAQDSGYGGEAIHNMTRWDWAQDLFEWFEYYLKGVGPKPDNHAQIQRNDGEWRIEELWPPQDATWQSVDLASCNQQGSKVGGVSVVGGGVQSVTITCDGFEQDVHIAGLPTLHLDVTASWDGGQVFAELQDAETGLRLGHATMDIRYHAGGYDPQTVFPGQDLVMLMEFQGLDVILPAGHGIRLVLTETGEDYLAPACGNSCPVSINGGTFSFPQIDRDGSSVFITPQGEDAANN